MILKAECIENKETGYEIGYRGDLGEYVRMSKLKQVE